MAGDRALESSHGSALEDGRGLASEKRGTRDEIYGDGTEGEESHFNTVSFPDDSVTRYKVEIVFCETSVPVASPRLTSKSFSAAPT